MGLHLKKAVRLLGVSSELTWGVILALGVYDEHGQELWVTSCTDSKHGDQSRHYLGMAVDLRVHNLTEEEKGIIFITIQERLTDEFVLLWEYRGEPREHFHLHFKGGATE